MSVIVEHFKRQLKTMRNAPTTEEAQKEQQRVYDALWDYALMWEENETQKQATFDVFNSLQGFSVFGNKTLKRDQRGNVVGYESYDNVEVTVHNLSREAEVQETGVVKRNSRGLIDKIETTKKFFWKD